MPILGDRKPTYDTVQCVLSEYHPSSSVFFDERTAFYISRIEFFKSAQDAAEGKNGTVIDLSSRKAAERALYIDKDNPEGLFGASEFSIADSALSMKLSSSGGRMAEYGEHR